MKLPQVCLFQGLQSCIDCQVMRIKIIKDTSLRETKVHPILLRGRKESIEGQYIILKSQLHSIQNYFNLLKQLNNRDSEKSTLGLSEQTKVNTITQRETLIKGKHTQKPQHKKTKNNTSIPQSLSCSRLNSLSLSSKTPMKTRTNWVGTMRRRKNHGQKGNLIKGTTTRQQIILSNQNRHLSVQHEKIPLTKKQSLQNFIPVGNTSCNNLQSYLSLSNIHTGLQKSSRAKTPIKTSYNGSRDNRYSSKIMEMQSNKRREKCKTEMKFSPTVTEPADEDLTQFNSIKKMIQSQFKNRSRASTPSAWENSHVF